MPTKGNLIAKLVVTASVLFGLCALGPAPLQGKALGLKPHTDLRPQGEQELEREQTPVVLRLNRLGNQVHPCDQEVAVQSGNHEALSVLSAAARTGGENTGTRDPARQVLGAATARMGPEANRSWVWIVLVLAGVAGGIFGVKRWADNNIPNAPTVTHKPQGW